MYGAYGGGRPGGDTASPGTTELTSLRVQLTRPQLQYPRQDQEGHLQHREEREKALLRAGCSDH